MKEAGLAENSWCVCRGGGGRGEKAGMAENS